MAEPAGTRGKAESLADEAAEAGLLGAILYDSDSVLTECYKYNLEPSDFYNVRHRRVYEAIQSLTERGRGVDQLTIASWLRTHKHFQSVGGNGFLDKLVDNCAVPAHAAHYAEIVKDAGRKRRLIMLLREVEQDVHGGDQVAEDILMNLQSKALDIADVSDKAITNVESLNKCIERFKQAAAGKRDGLPCFLPDVNKYLGCYRKGKIYFIGARPKDGKSTILQNHARFWAIDMNIPTAVVSAEMDHSEFLGRIVAEVADVSSFALESGMPDPPEARQTRIEKFFNACQKVVNPETGENRAPLWIDASITDIGSLDAWARFMHKKHGIQALLVDYLQIIHAKHLKHKRRNEEVAFVVESLRQLAKDLHIPIIILSQLTGEARKDATRRPRSCDMRETSEIEDAAYAVIMLYEWDDRMYFDIQRHRGGPAFAVEVSFQRNRQRFASAMRSPEEKGNATKNW